MEQPDTSLGGCCESPALTKDREHPANALDWAQLYSQQGYAVYRCKCGAWWGKRYQWDAGTGHDDRWHCFGRVDASEVKRHY